jgi:hypothetical protein
MRDVRIICITQTSKAINNRLGFISSGVQLSLQVHKLKVFQFWKHS